MAVALIGLAINAIIMGVMTGPAQVHDPISQVISTGAVLVTTFAANRIWTFRENSDASRG